MYAEDTRETDQKTVVVIGGRMILSDRLHAQECYMLKRKITIGQTEFFVYASTSVKIEVIDDLLELNCQTLKAWAAYPIQ